MNFSAAVLVSHKKIVLDNLAGKKDILEFRYNIKEDFVFRNSKMLSNFPFRVNKFSKYSMGCLALVKAGLI